MWYVYLISSRHNNWRYVGYTQDLKRRFAEHNNGKGRSTKPYAPFELEAYIAVKSKQLAKDLEQYFKGGSGKAWYRKRLLEDE